MQTYLAQHAATQYRWPSDHSGSRPNDDADMLRPNPLSDGSLNPAVAGCVYIIGHPKQSSGFLKRLLEFKVQYRSSIPTVVSLAVFVLSLHHVRVREAARRCPCGSQRNHLRRLHPSRNRRRRLSSCTGCESCQPQQVVRLVKGSSTSVAKVGFNRITSIRVPPGTYTAVADQLATPEETVVADTEVLPAEFTVEANEHVCI